MGKARLTTPTLSERIRSSTSCGSPILMASEQTIKPLEICLSDRTPGSVPTLRLLGSSASSRARIAVPRSLVVVSPTRGVTLRISRASGPPSADSSSGHRRRCARGSSDVSALNRIPTLPVRVVTHLLHAGCVAIPCRPRSNPLIDRGTSSVHLPGAAFPRHICVCGRFPRGDSHLRLTCRTSYRSSPGVSRAPRYAGLASSAGEVPVSAVVSALVASTMDGWVGPQG